jgi:DNA-directed RNA polymerase II subunit RPB2
VLFRSRKLHGTQIYYICPAETPEGGGVGVVKNMALSCGISNFSEIRPIIDILERMETIKIKDKTPMELVDYTMIYTNGDWEYATLTPYEIVSELREYRRQGRIHLHTSIVWKIDERKIEIYTDSGRCIRPLYIVENNKLKISDFEIEGLKNNELTWDDLVSGISNPRGAVIEYVDAQEMDGCMVAINGEVLQNPVERSLSNFTNCELHPALINGVLASIIPFSDHNQSPRNCYQSSMGKQAMGVYATNYLHRMDTLAHVLCYPQLPLINSRIMDFLPSNGLPSGINCVVAIASHSGFNQEDSIIMNKSAIDRGLFNSIFYRTYKDDEKKRQSSNIKATEKFSKPKEGTIGTRGNNYEKINQLGFPIENMYVDENDVIIGKVHPFKKSDETIAYKDCSTVIKANESGFIDKVIVSWNGEGYKFVKVRVRSLRKPTIGDKHACYTPDHDVLTETGWKPISEITLEDKVASLVNDRVVYQNPVEVMKYDINEKIYNIETNQVSLSVTMNHRMFVKCHNAKKYKMKKAEDRKSVV